MLSVNNPFPNRFMQPADDPYDNEINPVLWLEWRRDVHSCRAGCLFFLGLLMGLALFFLAVSSTRGSSAGGVMVVLAGIVFFPAVFFGVPFLGAFRLARQRIEEDLTLHTGMSGNDIMYGKLYRTSYLLACLYAPLAPGLLFCAVTGLPDIILITLFFFLPVSLALNMAALGFMAGAKSVSMAVLLTFLLFCFCLSGLFMASIFLSMHRYASGSLLNAIPLPFLFLLCSFGVFQMGTRIMEPHRPQIFVGGIALVLFFTAGPILTLIALNMYRFENTVAFLVCSFYFFGAPLTAVGVVQMADRMKRRSTLDD